MEIEILISTFLKIKYIAQLVYGLKLTSYYAHTNRLSINHITLPHLTLPCLRYDVFIMSQDTGHRTRVYIP